MSILAQAERDHCANLCVFLCVCVWVRARSCVRVYVGGVGACGCVCVWVHACGRVCVWAWVRVWGGRARKRVSA